MQTITLTEFNQNPSRATRLADEDEVLILRRGTAAYRLSRVQGNQADDPVTALVETGILTPPRATTRRAAHRSAAGASDLGAMLEADRDRLGD